MNRHPISRAHLCGLWDAVSLWVQWEDAAPERGYRLQVRNRPSAAVNWPEWRDIGGPKPLPRAWIVVPLWKAGEEVQARVAVAGTEAWTLAAEVIFQRARCRFEISTERRRVHYPQGTAFAAHVDAAPCHYRLGEEVELQPGETAEVELTAVMASGYCQLDYENHFDFRPTLGVRIRNLAASVEDVSETGRDFTLLAVRTRDTPLKVTFGKSNF